MKQRVALATITCLLAACEAFDPSYGAGPETVAFDAPVVSADTYASPVAFPPVGNLEVAGRLEGSLHGIRLSGETTQNYGSSSEWDGGGLLDMNVAVEGDEGAGMLIVSIDGGMEHPLFAEGRWTAESAVGLDGAGYVSVASCAGPVMGDWPYEQSAVDYEVLAEPDPEVPGSVVLVIAAAFYTDEYSRETSELSAVIRFTAPE